ncbi:MAG: phage antirepressor [Desulfobacterium sp.]|nr:phage antirepressor [Desulfobacterium sp.]
MDNNLINFEFNSNLVRVFKDEEGTPWWVAKDVCSVLEINDHYQAIDRLEDDERGRCKIPTPGGKQNMVTVNEPGLYTLIIRSNKPEAKRFKRWITHEVLPSIRKTGRYEMPGVGMMDEDAKKSNMIHYSVSGLCQEADKYLGGKAALTALNYFTGMPVDDLMDELESQKESAQPNAVSKNQVNPTVVAFVNTHCVLDGGAEVRKADLYTTYVDYCKDNNLLCVNNCMFFRSLSQVGNFRRIRKSLGNNRVQFISGIRLKNNHHMEMVG